MTTETNSSIYHRNPLEGADPLEPARPVHEDGADPIVKPSLVANKPGKVEIRSELEIHTQLAHRMFYGRQDSSIKEVVDGKTHRKRVYGVIGLIRFVSNVNSLYQLAMNDDPYADQKLMQIEAGIDDAKSYINERIEALKLMLDEFEGFDLVSNKSKTPVTLPVEFRTRYYGFAAANLVRLFDQLVRLGLTAKQFGLIIDSDWKRLITNAGTKIRHVFLISSEYKYTGAQRNDFAANNAVAISAIDKYGELPIAVLEGTQRAKYAPDIIKQGIL